MKAFVTGGKGFLGRHIVDELVRRGIETTVYDFIENENQVDSDKLTYIKGDILDFDHLKSAMEGCDLVFHTAAVADINIVRDIPEKTMEVNVVGTTKCLQAARENGIKRFIYASSVYSAGSHGSFYSISKKAGESLCKTYYEEFGLEYSILRYGSLYGTEANHWNFIYGVCRELLTTGKYTYTSSPDSLREYINILDASRESVRIACDPAFINKTVMITGHQRMKVKELFTMIEEIIGRDIEITYAPKSRKNHYEITPYSFEPDIPVRVNLPTYIDISEGILGCLKEVQKEIDKTE